MSDFTVGGDFDTKSIRVIVVCCSDGSMVSESTYTYIYGVMDLDLPDGPLTELDWVLADPSEHYIGLISVIRDEVANSGLAPERIGSIEASACICC